MPTAGGDDGWLGRGRGSGRLLARSLADESDDDPGNGRSDTGRDAHATEDTSENPCAGREVLSALVDAFDQLLHLAKAIVPGPSTDRRDCRRASAYRMGRRSLMASDLLPEGQLLPQIPRGVPVVIVRLDDDTGAGGSLGGCAKEVSNITAGAQTTSDSPSARDERVHVLRKRRSDVCLRDGTPESARLSRSSSSVQKPIARDGGLQTVLGAGPAGQRPQLLAGMTQPVFRACTAPTRRCESIL